MFYNNCGLDFTKSMLIRWKIKSVLSLGMARATCNNLVLTLMQ